LELEAGGRLEAGSNFCGDTSGSHLIRSNALKFSYIQTSAQSALSAGNEIITTSFNMFNPSFEGARFSLYIKTII